MAITGIGMFPLLAVVIGVCAFFLAREANKRAALVDPAAKYNSLAILAFVLSFFVSIAAVVIGHISLSQIKRSNERGWGLAAAALLLGYLGTLFGLALAISFFTGLT